MYTYIQSEPGLWTVGYYAGEKWESESDHARKEWAANRAHFLNGGQPEYDELVVQLMLCIGKLEAVARDNPKDAEAIRAVALGGRKTLEKIGFVLRCL
jgi:hypothetical protein